MQEGLKALEVLLDPYDWFHEVCAENRRYVVYVNYMNGTQDSIVPDLMMGRQVVIHFTASAPSTKSEYVDKPSTHGFIPYSPFGGHEETLLLTEEDVQLLYATGTPKPIESSIETLTDELDRLEKICGSNILQDIFYETHDGKNAVTNLRAKFPDVHQGLLELYAQYGFDTIYNELDG